MSFNWLNNTQKTTNIQSNVKKYSHSFIFSTVGYHNNGVKDKQFFMIPRVKSGVRSYTTRIAFNLTQNIQKISTNSQTNFYTTKKNNAEIAYSGYKNLKPKETSVDSLSRKELAVRTATRRPFYFSRAGNHSRREGVFTKFFKGRALSFREKSLKRTSIALIKSKKITPYTYFPAFYHVSTPFVRLKTRRRGSRRKRLKQKLTYRTQNSSIRQGFRLFAKTFRPSRHTSKNGTFSTKFLSQRESLTNSRSRFSSKTISSVQTSSNTRTKSVINKARSKSNAIVTTGNTAKTIRELRDEIHRAARRIKLKRFRRFLRTRRAQRNIQDIQIKIQQARRPLQIRQALRSRRQTKFQHYVRLSRKRRTSFKKFKPRYWVKASRVRRYQDFKVGFKIKKTGVPVVRKLKGRVYSKKN